MLVPGSRDRMMHVQTNVVSGPQRRRPAFAIQNWSISDGLRMEATFDQPGDLVAEYTASANLTHGSLNMFAAPGASPPHLKHWEIDRVS